MSIEAYLVLSWPDVIAVVWLSVCWLGYARFARLQARKTHCIASTLHYHRKQWMRAMMLRDQRVSDTALLSNLERNASFLASTAILVIAGLVTSVVSVDKVHGMLQSMPFFNSAASPYQLQFKLMLLLMIFVYAFFTFTWAMRQYGFCAVLLGAAPNVDISGETPEFIENYAVRTAKVIDLAGHSYNYGLRAYYFSLSILAWTLSAWAFIASVAAVVVVLYAREFHSPTLMSLVSAGDIENRRKTPKK